MIRILYWNLENFSSAKIGLGGAPAPIPVAPPGAAPPLTPALAAANRFHYIVTSVMGGVLAGGQIPDIIVVVEVYVRDNNVNVEGTVINDFGNAGRGVIALLNRLRVNSVLGALAAGTNWCVVPPLKLGEFGRTEAVAVFYNAARVQFVGPNAYYGIPFFGGIGWSQPCVVPAMGPQPAPIAYPNGWLPYLPALNRTTTLVPGGPAIPENQLAGEWQYYPANPAPPAAPARPYPPMVPPQISPNRIHFPVRGCRGPFLTQFLEVAPPGMPRRTLSLFSMHTSPQTAPAAVTQLQNVPAIMSPPGASEIKIVLGDFNVDPFSTAPNGNNNFTNYYAPLLPPPVPVLPVGPPYPGIYSMALDPRNPPGPAGMLNPVRSPYCMTHLLPTNTATPYNTLGVAPDAQHNVYPRYGYMGTTRVMPQISTSGAIDNILTAYGANAVPPPPGGPQNVTIVNTITGKPYTMFPIPAGVTPELTGGAGFNSTMPPPNMLNGAPPGGVTSMVAGAAAQLAQFRSWQWFGLVRSVSDHLALVIDV